MTDRRAAAALGALVAGALSGCSAPQADSPLQTVPFAPAPGAPGQTFEVPPLPPPVAWADDGERLSVTTYGSSSCPAGPADVAVVGDQELRVEIVSLFPDRDPCTADMAPRTTELHLPEGISSDEPVTVRLDHGQCGEETVVLPPAGE